LADPLAEPEEILRCVYAYVAYRVGDGPQAEDITSETLERAVKYRSSYKPELGSPAAWIIGIARRCIAEEARSRRRRSEVGAPEDWLDPGEESIARIDLSRALTALTDEERDLVALRYGADLRAREIAELLFVRTNTVEVKLHRALVKLRGVIAAAEGASGERSLERSA
jgi:RNA polymerase sigma-70 factor (ECF subfamily)